MSVFISLFTIALNAILAENFILVKFMGICPFMGVSKKQDTALGMGIAVTFVMGIASAATWAVNEFLLVPLNLVYMQTVVFILVIAALVQLVEMFLQKAVPALYQALGIYLPLITTNCAVLGVALLNIQDGYNFVESLVYGITGGIGFTVATSFTDWDGISSEMDFIGLKNYTKLLAPGSVFWTALMNNIIFMVVTVVIQAGLGLLLAVILKERLRGSSFFKAIFFMPIAMAPVIIAAIFRIIMDPNVGAINEALRFLHLDFLAQSWLGDPHIALYSICAINIFEWMGFSMIIYYAGLMSISDDIYEAAKIDGCGFWNTLFRITIPNLSGTTNTLILLGIVGSLKTFDIVIQTTGGGPGRSTEFLNTYLYKAGVQQFNGGLSAAIGVMVLIIAVMLSLIQLAFNKRANN